MHVFFVFGPGSHMNCRLPSATRSVLRPNRRREWGRGRRLKHSLLVRASTSLAQRGVRHTHMFAAGALLAKGGIRGMEHPNDCSFLAAGYLL